MVTRASNVFVCIKLWRRFLRMMKRMIKRMITRMMKKTMKRMMKRLMKRTWTNLVFTAQKAPLSILAHCGKVSKVNIATPFIWWKN